jgi:hypothetical protein
LSHSTSPFIFFVIGFFKIGSFQLFAQAGLILLISASWVARITGVSTSAIMCLLFEKKKTTQLYYGKIQM